MNVRKRLFDRYDVGGICEEEEPLQQGKVESIDARKEKRKEGKKQERKKKNVIVSVT